MDREYRRKTNRARERQAARKRRRSSMATPAIEKPSNGRPVFTTGAWWGEQARNIVPLVQDVVWYARNNLHITRWLAGFVVIAVVFFFLSYPISGRIFPNVSALGVGVGGQSIDDATQLLVERWNMDYDIDLYIQGEYYQSIRPEQLGLSFNPEETAKQARSAGFSGIPFGTSVAPVVELNYIDAQTYLLNLVDFINEPPRNASYRWEDGDVLGISGESGRMLDVTESLNWLDQNTAQIVDQQRFDLQTTELFPDVTDPTPYLNQVRQRMSGNFQLSGFDPFTNERVTWPISPEIFANWLEAGPTSLTLREDTFLPYVDQLNETLNVENDLRYISSDEAVNYMREAISSGEQTVDLRVRYRPTTYEVQVGDTAMAIARRTGIPFYMIEEANTGRNLDVLFAGDVLQIPSRDITMEHPPVVSKRIVVDLESQWLTAFENGQEVFSWSISSGVSNAVTSPGVYQILNHERVALGSSSTLCNSAGLECGVWEMNWFMGIYEVRPGLVNGFHGSVLLPNGNLLGGGAVGRPTTFGCVMSEDVNAQLLYEWAEIGTVVEIISSEYEPMSDLGWQVWNSQT